jgi:hypothetical protein
MNQHALFLASPTRRQGCFVENDASQIAAVLDRSWKMTQMSRQRHVDRDPIAGVGLIARQFATAFFSTRLANCSISCWLKKDFGGDSRY